jgi:hypothetical protein
MPESSNKLDIDLDFLDKKESARVASKIGAKEGQVENKIKLSMTTAIHPRIRYWARYLDIVALSLVLGIFLAIFMQSTTGLSNIFLMMSVLFVLIFAESTFLSFCGIAPGKWPLRINLKRPNGKSDFSTALNHSFAV